MSDRCRMKMVPDDELALKIIIWGCENELEKIRENAGPYTLKWLDEKLEIHEWAEDDEEQI